MNKYCMKTIVTQFSWLSRATLAKGESITALNYFIDTEALAKLALGANFSKISRRGRLSKSVYVYLKDGRQLGETQEFLRILLAVALCSVLVVSS